MKLGILDNFAAKSYEQTPQKHRRRISCRADGSFHSHRGAGHSLAYARPPFGDTEMPHIPGIDKVVHACMFGGLTFVGELDCSRWRIKRRNLRGDAALVGWHLAAVIALASIAFGGAIELLQGAMHMGRGADWLDWLADAVGAAVAVVVSPPVVRWVLALK